MRIILSHASQTSAPDPRSLIPDPHAAIDDLRSSVSTVRVRYSETDQMGFVYHPHYLVWCEIGRTDFIRGIGPSYAQLEAQGWLLAVTDASIRFAAPGRYDDLVRVICRVERVQSRSITFTYEIDRIDPEPVQRLATATTRLIALDTRGTPRTLPPELLQRFRDAVATTVS